jgi:putative oxidoreductase
MARLSHRQVGGIIKIAINPGERRHDRTAPYAATLLRVALGLLFLAHAGLKIFVFTPAGTAQFFGSLGLPPALAYLIIAIEVIGGISLVLGVYSRIAALALIPGMVGAIVTVHGPAGFFFNNPNGGWEYPAFWIVGLVVVALLGDGAYALRPAFTVPAPSFAR